METSQRNANMIRADREWYTAQLACLHQALAKMRYLQSFGVSDHQVLTRGMDALVANLTVEESVLHKSHESNKTTSRDVDATKPAGRSSRGRSPVVAQTSHKQPTGGELDERWLQTAHLVKKICMLKSMINEREWFLKHLVQVVDFKNPLMAQCVGTDLATLHADLIRGLNVVLKQYHELTGQPFQTAAASSASSSCCSGSPSLSTHDSLNSNKVASHHKPTPTPMKQQKKNRASTPTNKATTPDSRSGSNSCGRCQTPPTSAPTTPQSAVRNASSMSEQPRFKLSINTSKTPRKDPKGGINAIEQTMLDADLQVALSEQSPRKQDRRNTDQNSASVYSPHVGFMHNSARSSGRYSLNSADNDDDDDEAEVSHMSSYANTVHEKPRFVQSNRSAQSHALSQHARSTHHVPDQVGLDQVGLDQVGLDQRMNQVSDQKPDQVLEPVQYQVATDQLPGESQNNNAVRALLLMHQEESATTNKINKKNKKKKKLKESKRRTQTPRHAHSGHSDRSGQNGNEQPRRKDRSRRRVRRQQQEVRSSPDNTSRRDQKPAQLVSPRYFHERKSGKQRHRSSLSPHLPESFEAAGSTQAVTNAPALLSTLGTRRLAAANDESLNEEGAEANVDEVVQGVFAKQHRGRYGYSDQSSDSEPLSDATSEGGAS